MYYVQLISVMFVEAIDKCVLIVQVFHYSELLFQFLMFNSSH